MVMNNMESNFPNGNSNHCCEKFRNLTPSKVFRIVGWVICGLCLACFFALVFGFLVKWLWGMTLTPLFNLPELSYWQAVGLIILSRLLFGGFGHHKSPHHPPPPFQKRIHDCFNGDGTGSREGVES